jgi:hypothetical protein
MTYYPMGFREFQDERPEIVEALPSASRSVRTRRCAVITPGPVLSYMGSPCDAGKWQRKMTARPSSNNRGSRSNSVARAQVHRRGAAPAGAGAGARA